MEGPSTHLDILKNGANDWNAWRKQNPSTMPDLQQALLKGASLQEANLQGANLFSANLQEANLQRAHLQEANLQEATLQEANLFSVNLQEANLSAAYLQEANLQEANLQGANLQGANLQGATLQGATLEDSKELTQGQIERAFGDETTALPRPLQPPEGWALGVRAGNLRGAANDTVDVEDQLGFAHYVDAFAQLIDSPNTEPPLTIGIYGSWGTGKSFLLKHIKQTLENPEFKNRPQPPGEARRPEVYVVEFNAWEYSAAEVIWPGLVRKIMDTFEKTWGRPRRFFTRFRRNARRQRHLFRGRLFLIALILTAVLLVAFWQSRANATTATTLIDSVLALGGAITVLAIVGFVKLVTDTLANPLGQYVTALAEDNDYGKHIGYMTEIHEDLKQLEEQLHENNDRILVVIDDLDRCEPEKAVEVLQAINLLLNFPSFIVCLGIDARIITSAVDEHYEGLLGEVGASGYEYLEKIVQIPFRIPQPSEDEIKAFMAKQMANTEPSSTETKVETKVEPVEGRREEEPDEGVGSADREPPSEPLSTSAEDTQTDAQVAFTQDELEGFEDVAPFLRPNPRHLKRLVNVYRLVRTLAADKDERAIRNKPGATIRWLVICAQWPYTTHAMLWQYVQKLEEWDGRIPADLPAVDPLLYLLNEVSPRLSRDKQHELDDDPESLRKLLESKEGERLTWEELRRIRQYTVNFNPAVEGEMWALTEGETTGRVDEGQTFGY